jgi:SagB-type dehydrogenase family enzyme
MAIDHVDEFLLDRGPEMAWELFHENSKTSLHERHPYFPHHPTDEAVVSTMRRLRSVKSYVDSRKLSLPRQIPAVTRPFYETLLQRTTSRHLEPGPLKLEWLARLLLCSYGVTRDNSDTAYPRPFRVIPSGGALYPLELYVAARRVEGLDPGLYHYDPEAHELDVLDLGDHLDRLGPYLVQQDLAVEAAAAVLVSAVFFRSTFKYGDRGYRFALIEAGHLAQNALLVAGEMGVSAAPIGGYLDRGVDRLLGLDGIDESVVYQLLLGGRA